MTKAALKILCLIFLLAAPALRAQTGDAISAATDEAIRRQASVVRLREALTAANAARQRGDTQVAAQKYEECYNLAQQIGPTPIPTEYPQIVSGRTAVLTELAHEDQKSGHYTQAEEKYNRILNMDPSNQAVIDLEKQNMALIDAQRGKVPSPDIPEKMIQ